MKHRTFRTSLLLAICFWGIAACHSDPSTVVVKKSEPRRFSLLSAEETGVNFKNDLPYNDSLNCYLFRNFYNGGGVGIGDLNGDNLPDLFFCGNLVSNQVYLNKGNLKFENITEKAGLGGDATWTAGVAMADVNGDGLLDIYLCKSGPPGGARRHNELFINQGLGPNNVPTFSEQSSAYGLDFEGLSTHAAFFDYDRDGDLDCYLLNNSIRSVGGYDYRPGQRDIPDPDGGNRLLRNDKGHFSDVTRQAGIYSSAIGFGLGVTIGDYDNDGWQDIYVSNDFFERDYLYRNLGNGKFEECLEKAIPEISKGSMGADMADLNNDGYPEIFVTEMAPRDEKRYKTKANFDDWNTYQLMQQTGYHRQFGRNVLQLNNTDGTFTEVGRMAGVSATDWSWGALLADFDNDGYRDIFVANGIGKDLLDQDYINFYADPSAVNKVLRDNPGQGIKKLIDAIPSEPLSNYMFRNLGKMNFADVSTDWGLDQPSFSNGSAYADLDNDGDLELVINNANMPCSIYRNNTNKKGHWLTIKLQGEGLNTQGLGAKVTLITGDGRIRFRQELAPMRGFESCVDPRLYFGLGDQKMVNIIEVEFPSGKVWQGGGVPADNFLTIHEKEAQEPVPKRAIGKANPLFTKMAAPAFKHQESDFSDFNREPLLFKMFSAEGPCMATADVDGNGLEDMYVGGAAGQSGMLCLQVNGGKYKSLAQPDFVSDKAAEDQAAMFFDADGDGDVDLYVGSGSNEFNPGDAALQDRLYLNDGKGHFSRMPDALPGGKPFATSCVAPADIDGDGDFDLFVGMRLIPGHYGQSPTSFILKNDGKGRFSPNMAISGSIKNIGMVTDAVWADVDGDQDPDLLIAGDWEPLRLFRNDHGMLTDISKASGLEGSNGWWHCLTAADLDGDGDLDFVVGNEGLNTRFKAGADTPLQLYVNDLDQNGKDESIVCQYNQGRSYPVPLRNDMVRQMPSIKKKYLKFSDYAGQGIEDIFEPGILGQSIVKNAQTLQSAILWNRGNGKFELENLPDEAQRFPIYAAVVHDFNHDGKPEILLAGNHERCKPEVGICLAGRSLMLSIGEDGRVYPLYSGLNVLAPIRAFAITGNNLWIGVNNQDLQLYSF